MANEDVMSTDYKEYYLFCVVKSRGEKNVVTCVVIRRKGMSVTCTFIWLGQECLVIRARR